MGETKAPSGGGHKEAAWFSAACRLLVSAGIAWLMAARGMKAGGWIWIVLATVAGTAGIAGAGMTLVRQAVRQWRVADGMLFDRRGALLRHETTVKLDRITCVETRRNPLDSLLGCSRVRLFTAAGRRAALSLTLPECDASALTDAVANAHDRDGQAFAKRLAAGKYAALLGALDSGGTLLPLGLAALCGVFGVTRREWLWICAGCVTVGTLHFVRQLLGESGLSVWLSESGWTLQMGLPTRRRFYLPREAVIGILETRGAVALCCGAGRFELIGADGRRLPCMRWYTGGSGAEASLRLLRCEGVCRVRKGSAAAFRLRYGRTVTALLLILLPAGLLTLSRGEIPVGGRIFSAALLVTLTQCLMGIRFGEESGMAASSSAMRIGGMGMLCARRLTLRRGYLGRMTLRRSLLDRLDGTCTAILRPKGCRSGVSCCALPETAFAANDW